MKNPLPNRPLTFIFPHIHFDYTWDTTRCSSLWVYFVANNIVEPFIRLGTTTDYQPALAESWVFSADRRQLQIKLSNNYNFHDGRHISAEDIRDSFLFTIDQERGTEGAGHADLSQVLCDPSNKNRCSGVSLKENILYLSMNSPLNGLLFNLTTPEFGVLPKEARINGGTDKTRLKNLSGPYQILNFEKNKIELMAFRGHKILRPDSPERVDIIEITDFSKASDYLIKHNNAILVSADYASGLKLSSLQGVKYSSAPALTEFLVPNTRKGPLSSLETRKKVFSLISTKTDLSPPEAIAQKTRQIFTRDSRAYLEEDPLAKLYHAKISRFHSPMVLTMIVFDWMKDSPIPSAIKSALQEYNISLNIKVVGIKDGLDLVASDSYDLIYLYSGISASDPIIEFIYLFGHPLLGSFRTPRLAKLLSLAKIEPNQEKYQQLIKDLHFGVLSEYRILPLLHTKMVYLSGGDYELTDLNHFDGGLDIWRWRKLK